MNRIAASGLALALTVVALTAVAAEKFVIALPNGYEMARAKSGAPAINKKRGKVVVPGPIKAYAVMRDVVVGELDVPAPKDAAAAPAPAAAPLSGAASSQGGMPAGAASAGPGPSGSGKPAAADSAEKPAAASPVFTRPSPSPNGRYFVLDTKSGEVGKDLSLPEWEERLKKFDISSAPQLAPPILPK